MTRAICIGECMVELRPSGDGFTRGFAGDAYNTAVYLKREAPQADVQFLTVLGIDPLSAAMRQAWRNEDVGDELAFTNGAKLPGLYAIETDAEGERRFYYWRSDLAAKGWLQAITAQGGASLLHGADLIYLSGISLAILSPEARESAYDLLTQLRGKVDHIAFDPNYRAQLWNDVGTARDAFARITRLVDIVLPSQEDLERLFGVADPQAQCATLQSMGAREAAITTGPGRCYLLDGQARWIEGPRAMRVIDTSGAGDSFNGAYLATRLSGGSPDEAARAGLTLAAQVVGQRGALIPRETV